MDQLYIEVELFRNGENNEIFTTVESFIALYVYHYLEQASDRIKLHFVRVNTNITEVGAKLKLRSSVNWPNLCEDGTPAIIDKTIRDLRLPVYVCCEQERTYIAGLCAVCREMIKRQTNSKQHELLGFKSGCLQAPAEMSIWTKYIEIDMAETIRRTMFDESQGYFNKSTELLRELMRLEEQLGQPVRMHNIYKLARVQARANGDKEDRVSCIPKEQLAIKHRYVEGVAFTLADLMLIPYCFFLRRRFQIQWNQNEFPLVRAWFEDVINERPRTLIILQDILNHEWNAPAKKTTPPLLQQQEEKAIDENRFDYVPMKPKSRARIFTEQKEVDECLRKLKHLNIDFESTSSQLPLFGCGDALNWDEVEPEHEKNSSLPQERLVRKRQQLENMANAVQFLAKPGECIIDFCSGTGHLGILLALQLPQNTIILMENKPFSLAQARQRVRHLSLSNVCFYQCNIDYFIGEFDIGVALHACGTATDIVLKKCQRVGAKFVCCPCCYGALRPMPHIEYPLSRRIRNVLGEREFLYIAHCADQAHPAETQNCSAETLRQGQLCMDIVDTDRKLAAEERGYSVTLTRLHPEDCTPKNRLLVGTKNDSQEIS